MRGGGAFDQRGRTGAAVPVVLWAAYLYLSFWAIADLNCAPHPCTNNAPHWLQGLADLVPLAKPQVGVDRLKDRFGRATQSIQGVAEAH